MSLTGFLIGFGVLFVLSIFLRYTIFRNTPYDNFLWHLYARLILLYLKGVGAYFFIMSGNWLGIIAGVFLILLFLLHVIMLVDGENFINIMTQEYVKRLEKKK